MSDLMYITDFLEKVNTGMLSEDEGYREGQLGKSILIYEYEMPDLAESDIIIVGCPEYRGRQPGKYQANGPDNVRSHLYGMYYWHPEIRIADIGNIKNGATLSDTYAALKTVVGECLDAGKTVIIVGGSHDLTLAQYYAYSDRSNIIEAVCVDAQIDIDIDSRKREDSFLMEMLTGEPNYIRQYNHIGFQSYYVHPHMLQTMDKLRFDCFRVGHVKDSIEEMEPVIRSSRLFSFDISAIANSYAPANRFSPNGLNGEEACVLMRFAGMSSSVNSIGIYGYDDILDRDSLTAKQISQMIWYAIDGRSRGQREAPLDEKGSFNEYHLAFGEVQTVFLQSKKTGRWWMQLPDRSFIPCSHKDYLLASSDEIPERWLRAQERG
ncbi:formimidoylglutamase [Flavitalea sp.]|nr:formimidoylglutamase [Flavitalea sp.]